MESRSENHAMARGLVNFVSKYAKTTAIVVTSKTLERSFVLKLFASACWRSRRMRFIRSAWAGASLQFCIIVRVASRACRASGALLTF